MLCAGADPYWTTKRRTQADQCQGRDGFDPADFHRERRCIVPIDSFFEWKAIKSPEAQTALRDWDEERQPIRRGRHLGELQGPDVVQSLRTFATITTDANELVANIHNRESLIIASVDYK
jgi:putative SOS response-associated peptidase YedK